MTIKKSFYITTPIYYVNDSPHIGHAYTTIVCDVMARSKRLAGFDVKFLTGTDEHGQKVDKAAKAKNIDPQAFTDEVSKRFRALVKCPIVNTLYKGAINNRHAEFISASLPVNTEILKQVQDDVKSCSSFANEKCPNEVEGGENLLNISNDDFIRTTEERHKRAAQGLWEFIDKNGHIYKDSYAGWYSVRDEAYYGEEELTQKDGKKLAPTGAEVEWVEEESYFFKLSNFQTKLLDFYEKNPDFITPKSRYNEVVSFVKGGKELVEGALRDLSISRTTFNWGVPVPNDDKHIMYVWIDALTNYLTAIGFPDTNSPEYKKYWENTTDSPVHVVGKDILRFHAVYWPAFLMAANLPLPQKIVAHGWWTIEGEKMSKSLGNVIAPKDLIDEFGLDQTRYFLMREVPFGSDGNFSKEAMVERINSDLANNIGNLAQRTLSMIQKNADGKVPYFDESQIKTSDKEFLYISQLTEPEQNRYEEHIKNFRFDMILSDIVSFSSEANGYIYREEPWKLKKENPQRMQAILYALAESIRCIAIMLQPFVPTAAQKILLQLGYSEADFTNEFGGIPFEHLKPEHALKTGTPLPAPEGAFPRIENKAKLA